MPKNGEQIFDREGPEFPHDCDKCDFVGRFCYVDEVGDLYFCGKGEHPSILLRIGPEAPDYISIHWNPFGKSETNEFFRVIFDGGYRTLYTLRNVYSIGAILRARPVRTITDENLDRQCEACGAQWYGEHVCPACGAV